MLGQDGTGKTAILYRLKFGEPLDTSPTTGFNVETVTHKEVNVTIWDVAGSPKTRLLWAHYIASDTKSIIYVVDSADRERIDEARVDLLQFLQSSSEKLRDLPLLIYANKQDLPDAMTVAEVIDKLELQSVNNRKWHVQASSVTIGGGLWEGLEWLIEQCV